MHGPKAKAGRLFSLDFKTSPSISHDRSIDKQKVSRKKFETSATIHRRENRIEITAYKQNNEDSTDFIIR